MEPFMLKVNEEFKNISYVMKVTKEKERLKQYTLNLKTWNYLKRDDNQ